MTIHHVKMPFSKDFPTFQDWLKAHPESNSYNKRIIGEHRKHPKANLSQLRGHPGKKRKPISKLKPKRERKKPKKMEIVVSGNGTNDDRSMSAFHVYVEFYTRSSRDEKVIADEIFKSLEDRGILVFPIERDENINPVTVNFRDNVPKGGKMVSQKAAKEYIYNEISKEMHRAGPKNKPGVPHNKPGVSHHSKYEYERRKEQRRIAREEKRRRYDDNEF